MERNLERLANQAFDVLVVGGGIHGAVAAWDAALRGLSVALIERGDFGSATSQNSMKIIHGGLRYLQDGNPFRIRTMARERATWMRIAPHLVHPFPCLTPTRLKLSRSRLALGLALTVNDLLSIDRNRLPDHAKHLPRGRMISQKELARLLPGYDASASTGAAIWHDAQIYNSERLLFAFILSAVEAGAAVANYVEATGFTRQRDRVTGVRARDLHSGQSFEIRSKVVLNCTGAWIEELLGPASVESAQSNSVAMNVIVDKIWSGVAAGLPSRPAGGKPAQILFFVPWRDRTMIGTWHISWNGLPDEFSITEAVLRPFLDGINSAHSPLHIGLDDIQHVTWGFLPVNREDAGREPVKLTRDGVVIDHQKKDNLPGLISVIGVKYTTARIVAEKAVDLAVDKLGAKADRCQTHRIPVIGGRIDEVRSFVQEARRWGGDILDGETIEHLVYTYGTNYRDLLSGIEQQPGLATRIDPGSCTTRAEIFHATRHEMALRLEDVIQRRTELGSAGLPSMATLQQCAEIMGNELGWNPGKQQQEIEATIQKYPVRRMERVTA